MKVLQILALFLAAVPMTNALEKEQSQTFEVNVTEKGFEPSELKAKAGVPVVLRITRKTDSTCSTQIQVPAKKIKMDLPLNKTVEVALGNLEKGEIRFGCGMNMMQGGQILVQ